MGTKYVSQSQSGYNNSAPPDDGSLIPSNMTTWAGIKTKLGDPVLTLAQNMNTALANTLDFSGRATAVNDTCLASDHMKTIECTVALTATLIDLATVSSGFIVSYKNTGTGVVSINLQNAANTLDGTVNGTTTIPPGGWACFKTNTAATGYLSYGLNSIDTHNASSKTPPVDADELPVADSASSFSLKKLTWANLKATLVATANTWTAVQTFSSSPIVPNATTATQATAYGQAGSAGIAETHAATTKATPVDADELPVADSASSFSLKKLTWANLKSVLQFSAPTTSKATPVDADAVGLYDSAATTTATKLTWANLKTTLGSTFAALAGSASQLFSVAAATAAEHAVRADRIQLQSVIHCGTTGGTSTAYTCAAAPALAANTAKTCIRATLHTAAGATPTLAVNGLTALPIKYVDSTGTLQAITSTQAPAISSDFECDGTNWVMLNPVPVAASSTTLATQQNTTSGTSWDFSSIPSGVREIKIMPVGCSTNGTSDILVQIGDSGGIETFGYTSSAKLITTAVSATTTSTAGFIVTGTHAVGYIYHGCITLSLENASTNTWMMTGLMIDTSLNYQQQSVGSKSLSATLDRLRVTTVNGTDAGDAGVINISYTS